MSRINHLLLCLALRQGVLAVEVVLLDSKNVTLGNWTSVQHDGDPLPPTVDKQALYMWKKQGVPGFNPQFFFVCTHGRATSVPQDNWIRSPFFAIKDAAVVSLDISYDVERCNMTAYPKCKEEFSVYFQFADGVGNSDPINGTYFTLSVHLPQDKSLLSDNFINDINVTVPSKRGMFIAFRDTGSCTNIHQAIVRYKYCPSITENLAVFPRTAARVSKVFVEGKCRENASSQSSVPQKLCLTSGDWSALPAGSCECDAGHELAAGVCKACSNGTYKHLSGNNACRLCPRNSHSDQEGSTNCTCLGKYFRVTSDVTDDCTAPPSAIRSHKIEEVKSRSVKLSWQLPEDHGGRTDLGYKIYIWWQGNLIRANRTSSTYFALGGLKPNTHYKISLMSYNGAGDGPKVVFNVTTATEPVTSSSTPSTAVTTSVDSTNKSVSVTSTVRPTGDSSPFLKTTVGVAIIVVVVLVVLFLICLFLYWCYCKNHPMAGKRDGIEPQDSENGKFLNKATTSM